METFAKHKLMSLYFKLEGNTIGVSGVEAVSRAKWHKTIKNIHLGKQRNNLGYNLLCIG